MASVNKWIGIGNLGSDPEVKYVGERAVCNFSLACNEKWKAPDGTTKERVEWVRIVVWGSQAEPCGQYLAKGRQAYVEGKLQTRKWTDKHGVERYTTEVMASSVVFLGGKADDSRAPAQAPAADTHQQAADEPPPF